MTFRKVPGETVHIDTPPPAPPAAPEPTLEELEKLTAPTPKP
jgi:hypothetical protein